MPNVSIRFSTQDAEVVRTALQALGKDGETALKRIEDAQSRAGGGSKSLGAFIDELRGKFLGLAVPLGPVGSGLIALGPAGTAAAIGIGAVISAIGAMGEAADRIAAKAQSIRDFARLTGLTGTQIQALNTAGGDFGITTDRVQESVEKFSSNLNEVHDATGKVYELVLKINPQLADQMVRTRDTATSWNLLAQAYRQATTDQRNALASAAFGRGNQNVGNLLGATADAGGMSGIVKDFGQFNTLTDEQIKKLAETKIALDNIKTHYSDTFSLLFAENRLQTAKDFAKLIDDIVGGLKTIQEGHAPAWMQSLIDGLSQLSGGEAFPGNGDGGRPVVTINKTPTLVDVPFPQARPDIPATLGPETAVAALNAMQRWTSVLGAAITPAEQLKLKIAELNAAQEKGGINSEVYKRAEAGATLAMLQAIEATRERLGIASQEEIVTQRLKELDDLRAKGFITNAADMARAEQVIRKEAKASSDAIEVRAAALPGLKQFELDATNLNKALDTTATQGVNDLTGAIVDFEMGNKKAGQSATDLAISVGTAINQMIVKMTIAAPIARSLQSLIGGFLPGGGNTGPDLGGGIWPAAKGAVFSTFASGGAFTNGIFSQPTFFRFANGGAPALGVMGEAGDEAVMPLRRGAGGRLGVTASVPNVAVNLAPQINISVDNRNGSKVSASKATPNQGGGFDMSLVVEQFEANVADNISTGRSPNAKSLEQNYGVTRKFG